MAQVRYCPQFGHPHKGTPPRCRQIPQLGLRARVGQRRSTSDLFRAVFQEANGNDNLNNALWVDETHMSWLQRFYSVIFYHSNYTWGEYGKSFQFLLKIDWLDDEDFYDGATIPDRD